MNFRIPIKVIMAAFLSILIYSGTMGYWHCGDRICGNAFWRNCCDDSDDNGLEQKHSLRDVAETSFASSHPSCEFSISHNVAYASVSSVNPQVAPVDVLPPASVVVFQVIAPRQVLLHIETRGPPFARLDELFPTGLRAPPLS